MKLSHLFFSPIFVSGTQNGHIFYQIKNKTHLFTKKTNMTNRLIRMTQK